MLKIIRTLRELEFGQLMDVYAQSNMQSGRENQLLSEQDFYNYLRECFFTDPQAFYGVWVVDNRYRSALRMEPYNDGLLLAALETAPDERGKGYARALVSAVLEALEVLEETRVYSHVKKENRPSLAVHKACGFQEIKDYAVLADGSVMRNFVTLSYLIHKK